MNGLASAATDYWHGVFVNSLVRENNSLNKLGGKIGGVLFFLSSNKDHQSAREEPLRCMVLYMLRNNSGLNHISIYLYSFQTCI